MDASFYLKNLIIQNFATFKNQTISFKPGFNAIIGETGSGKSLVLDALQLILGGRADKKIVRRDTEFSLIEATFFCKDKKVLSYLEAEGFPVEGHEIIIKRLIYKNGATKTYINHLNCTVTFLSCFARKYIDLVGQFENQKLLSESYQLQLLDHYAKQQEAVSKFQAELRIYKQYRHEYEELIQSKSLREQRLDYLNFQLQEIEQLNPSSQDEEDLLKKKNMMINLERTQKLCFQAKNYLEGDENNSGMLDQLKLLAHLVNKNPDLFQEQVDLLIEIEDRLSILQSEIENKLNLDADPQELESILDRLDVYQKLKRKFGGTVETVLQMQIDFLKEKNQLEGQDISLGELETKIKTTHQELIKKAELIHSARVKSAKYLAQELTHKVRHLKMNGATLKLEVEKLDELNENGMTRSYFMAETNPGEGYFKIKDIASGGELSRILLSLRQILSSHDSISIFLFDEIDTGIGGETGTAIGKALSEVALNGQVIAITHLPQIAQYAELLVVINKDINNHDKKARTESVVRELYGNMIQKEVMAMAQLG